MEERKYADLKLDADQDDKLATEVTIDGDKITSPENYLIGKITKVDNGLLVEFIKKQSQYPKTYGECHELMVQWKEYDCNPNSELILCDVPIHDFCKLIVARNIYWKIAGEEMGLGKPWEPDYTDDNIKYNITIHKNELDFNCTIERNYVLIFPTEEMRDAFYRNFKEMIEQCKELL